MSLKKIIVCQFKEDDFEATLYFTQNGGGFSGRGSTANAAIGEAIFSYGFKFGIEIETENRRRQVVSSRKPTERIVEIKCPECEGHGGHEIEQICPKCRDRGTIFVKKTI